MAATRTWPVGLLALVLAVMAGVFAWRRAQRPAPPVTSPPANQAARALSDAESPGVDPAMTSPAPAPGPVAAACSPHAERRCSDGDVWWFNGCGERDEKAVECDLHTCRDGACQYPDPLGCDEPITGRCEGDTVRTCFGGRLRTIDCGTRGLHCVMGAEGAECRAEPDPSVEGPSCLGEAARCAGDVLVRCLGGREVRQDCASQGGICLDAAPGLPAVCAQGLVGPFGTADGDCDACGCPPRPDIPERCNGEDDDGDGLLDQDVDCGPIPLLALVVGEPGRFGSYDAADIEREVSRVNDLLRASAVDAPPLQVALEDILWLAQPEWQTLTEEALDALVRSTLPGPPRDEFTLPVLFTDEVVVGEVPKPGTSTLPNATCGGSQHGRGPDLGLIAVSKARSPTTVAHEIGHFLGLCHTHAEDQAQGVRVAREADGSLLVCDAPCTGEGDGVCDTPIDPGVERCPYNSQCQVFCAGPETPDASNLMSYYTACRFRFTPEQQRRMRHTLALRRAWHGCLGAACTCTPGGSSCPPAMACRPHQTSRGEQVHACSLEGPSAPGAACDSSFDCRADSRCVGGRDHAQCVRVCGETATPCRCVHPDGLPVAVCAEDLP